MFATVSGALMSHPQRQMSEVHPVGGRARRETGTVIQTETVVRSHPDPVAQAAIVIDEAMAAEVGQEYLSARTTPRDELVAAAYGLLEAQTDLLFAALGRSPAAVRIVFTCCRQPYGSDQDLIAAVRTERLLEITTAAVGGRRAHPLLGCELGGPFDRFRAVHDLVGHAATGLGFDLEDEWAAWLEQDRLHRGLARRALATELFGLNSARWLAGEPPEHKAVLMSQGPVERMRRTRGRAHHHPKENPDAER